MGCEASIVPVECLLVASVILNSGEKALVCRLRIGFNGMIKLGDIVGDYAGPRQPRPPRHSRNSVENPYPIHFNILMLEQ